MNAIVSQFPLVNEKVIENAIKANEIATGQSGALFCIKKVGQQPTVFKLETSNGFLVIDGKELLDLSQVELVAFPS